MTDADGPSEPWTGGAESTLGDGGPGGVARVVLVADRSDEGERMAATLRAEGFSVITSDVVALPERVARLRPFAVLLDVEQPHAEAAVHRIVDSADDDQDFVLVGIGSRARAASLGMHEGSRLRMFERPVDADEVVAYLLERASLSALVRTEIPPSQASAAEADSALLWDFPALAGLPEVESILPDLDGTHDPRALAKLSPEIEALLEQGARRVQEAEPEQPASTRNGDIALSDDVLASIDEVLQQDELSNPGAIAAAAPSVERLGHEDDGTSARIEPAPASEPPITSHGTAAPGTQVGAPRGLLDSSPPKTSSDLGPTSADHAPSPSEARRDRTSTGTSSVTSTSDRAPASVDLAPLTRPGPPAFSTQHPSTTRQRHPPFAPGAAVFDRRSAPFSTQLPGGHTRVQPPPPAARRSASAEGGEAAGAPSSQPFDEVDPMAAVARAVRSRATGALVLSSEDGSRVRRILLREGDLVNAASEVAGEALVPFLVERGDLSPEVAELKSARVPQTGRHAAAALIANGFLGQDDLWPVLRAHAEWIIARALDERPSQCQLEREPPERLRAEPNVFGGAAGVEVFIEAVRRVLSAEEAVRRLGGYDSELAEGPSSALLAESALSREEMDIVRGALGAKLGNVLAPHGPELAAVLYALAGLQIVTVRQRWTAPNRSGEEPFDPLDAEAVRRRVRARLALVQESDYFSLLGLRPSATGHEIRRAYLELRRTFEPARLLTAATADLAEDVDLIVDVLDEAYQVLRDPNRRSRYRRAIEAGAP